MSIFTPPYDDFELLHPESPMLPGTNDSPDPFSTLTNCAQPSGLPSDKEGISIV
jgi:hypothetical protein